MLTGLVKGLLLCCDDYNSTFYYVNENVANGVTPLLWSLQRVIIPIILAIGIFGNSIISFVLCRPIFRGIAYLYFNGIALAHLGVLVSWIPIQIRLDYETQNNYPSTFYSAHLELVALNTFSTAGTLIMTCLVVDRYIFLFCPARIRTGNARKNAKSFILYAFILGFAVSAPLTGMRMIHEQRDATGVVFVLADNTSVTRTTLWLGYVWLMGILTRACPIVVLIILNSLIIKRFLQLNAKKKKFQSVSEKFRTASVCGNMSSRNRGYREEQHLTALTTCLILSFVITTIPTLLLALMDHTYTDYYLVFRTICVIIELSNFAIHIGTYVTWSEEFRCELNKILKGRCNASSSPEPERPVGEIEDYSRHGTTIRLTPEPTKLNSPTSPRRLTTMEEVKESELCIVDLV